MTATQEIFVLGENLYRYPSPFLEGHKGQRQFHPCTCGLVADRLVLAFRQNDTAELEEMIEVHHVKRGAQQLRQNDGWICLLKMEI